MPIQSDGLVCLTVLFRLLKSIHFGQDRTYCVLIADIDL